MNGFEWDPNDLAEFEASFAQAWTCVGRAESLAGADRYLVYEAAPRSLLLCRDGDGVLGAFVNACTHRGTRLCREAGEGKIQCPYHGWVFDTGGRLLGASKRAGLPAFDDADYGLRRLAVETVEGWVFVHGDSEPPEGLVLAETVVDLLAQADARLKGVRARERELAIGWREAVAKAEGELVGANLKVTVTPNLVRAVEVRPHGPRVCVERIWSM